MPDAPEGRSEVIAEPVHSTLPEHALASEVRESIESVADATNPTTDDPFVDLHLVDAERWAAPGGWPRAVVGVGVGLAAGWLVTMASRGDRAAGRRGSGS